MIFITKSELYFITFKFHDTSHILYLNHLGIPH